MMAERRRADKRVVLLGAVLATMLLLVVGVRFRDSWSDTSQPPADAGTIVQRLLRVYHIEPQAVRTRKITVGAASRIERRVSVSTEFNTLNFNRDLSRALAEIGMRVTASEKLQDNSVTMHIKKDGLIVESIIFLPKRLQQSFETP